MKKVWVLSYPISAQRRLIRLGWCPGWSEFLLGAHSLCWFCHEAAHFIKKKKKEIQNFKGQSKMCIPAHFQSVQNSKLPKWHKGQFYRVYISQAGRDMSLCTTEPTLYKMSYAPGQDSGQPPLPSPICAIWSVLSVSLLSACIIKLAIFVYPTTAQWRHWLDTHMQADLSLRRAHAVTSFCRFCCAQANFWLVCNRETYKVGIWWQLCKWYFSTFLHKNICCPGDSSEYPRPAKSHAFRVYTYGFSHAHARSH